MITSEFTAGCIDEVYDQLEHYIVIGLTGRCGSGCSTTRRILCENEFDPMDYLGTDHIENLANDDRDLEIILNFVKANPLLPFNVIRVRDILTTYILEDWGAFFALLNRLYPKDGGDGKSIANDFYRRFKELILDPSDTKILFDDVEYRCSKIWKSIDDNVYNFIQNITQEQYDFLFTHLDRISETIRNFLIEKIDKDAYTLVYQTVGNVVRTYGSLNAGYIAAGPNAKNINAVASRVNFLIKILRRKTWIIENCHKAVSARKELKSTPVHIVIDSIKNVFEASYLKSRYRSFYLVALTLDDANRKKRLMGQKELDDDQIELIDTREQHSKVKPIISRFDKTGTWNEESLVEQSLFQKQNDYNHLFLDSHRKATYMFNLQDVDGCIQNADILISNTGSKEALKLKIMRYVCLMTHPGLVPPTNDEYCMQIAQTAKLRSGCISRQVGAVVTDRGGNVLSVGWNDPSTTYGNECVGCVRRSLLLLAKQEDDVAYSYYELHNPDFRDQIRRILEANLGLKHGEMDMPQLVRLFEKRFGPKLKGLPLAFCFKNIYTNLTGDCNQVHTRAQHGEEKALENCSKEQASGGTLYTTSSSCELCAKKALSYNIQRLVYIEPYSGIANEHVLGHEVPQGVRIKRDNKDRVEPLSIELFTGATQKAYEHLYTPVFPPKDELALRGVDFKGK